jgi:predicted O-methyltransferase YrrM
MDNGNVLKGGEISEEKLGKQEYSRRVENINEILRNLKNLEYLTMPIGDTEIFLNPDKISYVELVK